MINIKQIKGTAIKKYTGAKRVRKTYHNIQKSGAGNFGFVVVFDQPGKRNNEDWYRIDGEHGSDGVVYNLKVNTYGTRTLAPGENERIEGIMNALNIIANGGEMKVPPQVVFKPGEIGQIERLNVRLRQGYIPQGKIDLIHYYILEDANFHSLNSELTRLGKFGASKRNRSAITAKDYYTPKGYGTPILEARFRQYQRKGGRTYQL